MSDSLATQQGPDGREAPTRSGWCFRFGRQMARAQNLLALPTPPDPKPWSGRPCVGLEGSEGGTCGPGLGLCSSLPDCGGLWELPCEGSVSTSASQGVRGHSVLVLSEESEAICQLKPIIQGSRIPRGKGLAGVDGSLL